jgi:hypothetical protein
MRTIIYRLTNHRQTDEWWWADADNHRVRHGPFRTRAEAADAARAARITAQAAACSVGHDRGRSARPATVTTIEAASHAISCEIVSGIARGLKGSTLSSDDHVTAIALGIERAVRAMEEAFAPELRWALARRFALARSKQQKGALNG